MIASASNLTDVAILQADFRGVIPTTRSWAAFVFSSVDEFRTQG